jgi:site-specific DNA recombinase
MHYIRYEDLYSIVLNDIRRYAELAKKHERELVEAIRKSRSDSTEKQLSQYKREIDKAEKRLSEISQIIKRLYEDSVMGKLADERFYEMSKGYEIECAELKEFIREAQAAISAHRDTNSNSQRFADLVKKYFEVDALDAMMLNGLIEKVVIHERDVSQGERRQKIDIYYNFVGILDDGEHTFGDRRFRETRSEKYPTSYPDRKPIKKNLPPRLLF